MELSVAHGAELLTDARPYVSIEALIAVVRKQHRDVADLAADVPEPHLHDEFSYHPRTLAEQLGHLSEQRRHVARQLIQWRRGQRTVLGRHATDDPDLADGLLRATTARLRTLLDDLDRSAAELEDALTELDDGHLRATIHHVIRGREPLATYLTRVVVDHGQHHRDELAWTLETLTEPRA